MTSPIHQFVSKLTEEHPHISLFKQLDLRNLGEASDLFAEDFVWHYFNSHLPDLEGDYVGLGAFRPSSRS